jgi:uncharacterized membrane protein HdeD (DUF308 family)
MRAISHGSLAGVDESPRAVPVPHRHHVRWPIVALRALTALVVGLCALLLPMLSIAALLALVGGYTLVSAGTALDVARTLARRREPAWPFLVYGLVAAAVAALLIWWPPASDGVLLVVLALWLALGGAAELMLATQLQDVLPHARLLGVVGLVSIVAAVALLLLPRWTAAPEGRVLGLYALLSGLFLTGFAARLRREARTRLD